MSNSTRSFEPGQPTDEVVIALLRQAARDTDPGFRPDLPALVRGGRRRIIRRRHASLGAAAGVVALLAVLVGPLGGLNRIAAPPADGHPSPLPSPTSSVEQERDRVRQEAAERAKFARLLADPHFGITDVQYTSASDAAVLMQSCSDGRCEVAVLTTRTNWRDQTGTVLPRAVSAVTIRALPGGYVAVIPSDRAETGAAISPFVMHPDGTTTPLTVSTEVREPRPSSVLLAHPPLRAAAQVNAAIWAIDPATAELYPIRTQPCGCQGQRVTPPGTDADGTVHTTIQDPDGVEWDFAQSRDNGLSWQTSRTNVLYNSDPNPSTRGTFFTAGPEQRLAAAFTAEGSPSPQLRALYVSDDERNWHQVDLGGYPGPFLGMAYTPDGTLLLNSADDGFYRLTPGGQVVGPIDGPRATTLYGSGGVLIAPSSRTVSVSTDGLTWQNVSPGAALIRRALGSPVDRAEITSTTAAALSARGAGGADRAAAAAPTIPVGTARE